MDLCVNMCAKNSSLGIRRNIIDILAHRSLNEKILSYCHIECIRLNNGKNYKRNDRWGFIHIFGISELFSSLFSLLHFFIHIYFFRKLILSLNRTIKLSKIIHLQYYICITTLVFSTILHVRDTQLTRYLDYFSAYLGIMIGMAMAIYRLLLFLKLPNSKKYTDFIIIFGSIYFIYHVYKMAYVDFNKIYNKIACGFMFGITFSCDLFLYYRNKNKEFSKYLKFYLLSVLAGIIVEISDIPPMFYIFDSHALWHLLILLSSPYYLCYLYHFISDQISEDKIKND